MWLTGFYVLLTFPIVLSLSLFHVQFSIVLIVLISFPSKIHAAVKSAGKLAPFKFFIDQSNHDQRETLRLVLTQNGECCLKFMMNP